MKYWEIIADNLSKAGWSWGCSSEIDSTRRVLFTADAYFSDGRRFIVLSDDKLSALFGTRIGESEAAANFLDNEIFLRLDVLNGFESGGGLPPPRSVLRLFRTRNHEK